MSDNGGGEGSGSNRAVAVDDALERVGFGFGQYLILANMGVSLFGEGMQLVVVYYLGETLHQDLACSDFLVAWVDTAILAGLGVGCFIGGSCSDIFGRKPTLQVANLFAAILGVASAFVPSCWVLLVVRFFLGTFMGAFIPASIALVLETTPVAYRDTAAIAIPIALGACGKITVAALADLLHESSGEAYIHWRFLLFLCAVPDLIGLILELLSITIPSLHTIESPYWLLAHSRGVDASKDLRHLAEQNGREAAFGEGTALSIPEKEVKQDHEHHYLALAQSSWAKPALVGAVAQSFLAFVYFGLLFAIPMHMERWVADDSMAGHWSEEEKDSALLIISLAELPAALVAAFVLTRRGETTLHDVVLWSVLGLVATCFLFGFQVVSMHPSTWVLGFLSRGLASLAFETAGIWIGASFPDRFRGTALSMVEGLPRIVAAFSPEVVLFLQPLGSSSANNNNTNDASLDPGASNSSATASGGEDEGFLGFQAAPSEPEFLLFGALALAGLGLAFLLPDMIRSSGLSTAAGGSAEEEEEEPLLDDKKAGVV